MTLRKIENFDGKDRLYGFFYACVKFHEKLFLNVVRLTSFVGIVKM